MLKITWCTDTHLDFLPDQDVVQFAERLVAENPNVIMITGDISISQKLVYHLSMIESVVKRPVYYVLGNHDYYGGIIQNVRQTMKEISNMSQYLRYLPTTPYVQLSPSTALIGHDGWYDATAGVVGKTNFVMNDWIKIGDYALKNSVVRQSPNYKNIIEVSQKLAHESVVHISGAIKAAAKYYKVIVIATHFPPFEEVHQHNERSSDPGVQPWYTSKVLGETLKRAAEAFPNIRFEVF